ncbi:hypothetical protein BASA50_000816 [Batrachochytrium salamandrivorans]|uniref:Extracellular metalloproteinase n=1 Tax=Batrachochytrium salamandrivorans TaxID=1357716 RepID=A0ABQ8ESY0_9FUNG|nr:hypothetical protein BASA50_000816 [Batrachochytrium salamandrivorans]
MVAVSLFLVLALVSSTVVARPGIKGLTSPPACLKPLETSEISTKIVYEWIPPSEELITLTSNGDPVEIGLKYILQKLGLRSNEFMVMKNFTDHSGSTHMYGVPLHEGVPIENLRGAAHIKNDRLRDNPMTRWLQVKVNANTGGIVSMENFKMGFTYTALELPNKSPEDGFSKIIDPENIQSSPKGWTEGYKLAGNNALASIEGGRPFETTAKGIFGGVANTFHDVLYKYGFTESAGNFQENNFGRGGIGEDPVLINVQNSREKNNAAFYSPPDGQSGRLYLHIYTVTEPSRDPALDNTMLTHELTHGLSNRLTGGAHNNLCMKDVQSGGLSEGYSDMVSLIFTEEIDDERNTRRVIGGYVKGNSKGLRKYPYTTNIKVNPLTYKDAVGEEDRYNLGAIWTTMLFEVYWNFVDAHGFSTNLHDATQKKGNIMFLQILVGTLMLQPCNPTFESARAAMLAADYAYYGGINKHLINKGFAKRSLGSIS